MCLCPASIVSTEDDGRSPRGTAELRRTQLSQHMCVGQARSWAQESLGQEEGLDGPVLVLGKLAGRKMEEECDSGRRPGVSGPSVAERCRGRVVREGCLQNGA